MVADGSERKKSPSYILNGAAGAFSGSLTRFFCQPLDVVKISLQLQVESKSHKNVKYRSILQTFSTVLKEEGVYGLWKGHVSAQLLSIVYGMNQFAAFELSRNYVSVIDSSLLQDSLIDFACGYVSGSFATVTSYPFDVIRTRVVAQGNVKVYKSIFQSIHHLYKAESWRGFYKGFSATVLQTAPNAGAQFMFYNLFSRIYLKANSKYRDVQMSSIPFAGNAVIGFVAGICAKTTVYPFDLCRKRLQIQGFQHARGAKFGEVFVCNGLLDCIYQIYKKESVFGFYKGLNASLLKASITTALSFSLYRYFVDVLLSSSN